MLESILLKRNLSKFRDLSKLVFKKEIANK